jgi:hypothetical protein
MPSRDHITPVDSPIVEETLRQSVTRVANHCAALDYTVGQMGADVARVHQRLDAWGCPSIPNLPPMRAEFHSSPEEVREIALDTYRREHTWSDRVRVRARRDWKTWLLIAGGGAEVIEHTLKMILAGHL